MLNKSHVVKTDSDGTYLFTPEQDKFRRMISNYSQEILYCSYNDDTVFEDLLLGNINREIAQADQHQRDFLKKYHPDVIDFEKELMELMVNFKAWPDHWVGFTPLKELGPNYKSIIRRANRDDLLE